MVEYWQHCRDTATLDRARGTYAAILPRLEEATGLPATELARESVRRWLTARKRDRAAEGAAYRASLARWYRTYGPNGHHRPDLEYW